MRAALFYLASVTIFAFAFFAYIVMEARAEQQSVQHTASRLLKCAYDHYRQTRKVPTPRPFGQVIVHTNVVVVGGVREQCALKFDSPSFRGGFLAISTNETVLWITKHRTARIIGSR